MMVISNQNTLRAVLFDKDGTLVDSFAYWIQLEAHFCNRLIVRWGPGQIGLQTRMLVALGIVDGQLIPGALLATATESVLIATLHQVMRADGCHVPDSEIFKVEAIATLKLVMEEQPPVWLATAGADALVRHLHAAGYRLGIATSDSYLHTKEQLAALGWTPFFDWIGCGDTVREPKPAPGMLLDFAAFCGIPATAVAVVGDSRVDLGMARAGGAGLMIGLATNSICHKELELADLIVPSLDKLTIADFQQR